MKEYSVKKRIGALLLALSMCAGMLAGCSSKQEATPEPAPAPEVVEPAPAEPEKVALPDLSTDLYGNAAVGYEAAVVSANEYTSGVGMEILQAGGNAVDAAVAMLFANSLTEPGATSLGGAGFMTVYLKESQEYVCIEFLETAPAAAGIDTLEEINAKKGAMLVTVPGQVHGALSALEKYGTMTREEVLAPVIKLAEEGFPVFTSFQERASSSYNKLVLHEEAAKIFTNDGLPWEIGDHFTNPDYANTLRKIAEGGIDEFYKGSIAQAIVDEVQRLGGLLTMEDMANYTSVEREPISTTYHGYEIVTHAPPSMGGGAMLEMLNILEQYDLVSMGFNSAEYLHTFNEAYRLAMADASNYFADPDFYDLPIDTIISKEYAKKRVEENMPAYGTINETLIPGENLSFQRAMTAPANESGSTTHVSVIDEFGNMVSLTHTIGGYFGACIVAPGTGFPLNAHLNNQYLDLSLKDNPNFVEGGKRVLSTMCPALVVKDGEPVMAIGSPGSWCIPTAIAHVLNATLLFDMDLQEAINMPRANVVNTNTPKKLLAETGLDFETQLILKGLGYEVTADKEWNTSLGSVGCILKHEDGYIYAGGDPRRQYKSLAY